MFSGEQVQLNASLTSFFKNQLSKLLLLRINIWINQLIFAAPHNIFKLVMTLGEIQSMSSFMR